MVITVVSSFKTRLLYIKSPDNMKSDKVSFVCYIQIVRLKTSEDVDTIYKNISAHTHIEYTITYKKLVILISTRELSKNFIIRKVAYNVIRKYIVIPNQEMNIIEKGGLIMLPLPLNTGRHSGTQSPPQLSGSIL